MLISARNEEDIVYSDDLRYVDNDQEMGSRIWFFSVQKFEIPKINFDKEISLIHDFNSNLTGLVDKDGHQCFVKPLDRNVIKPPHSLFDLWQKMWKNMYKATDEDFRDWYYVMPKIENISELSSVIANSCNEWPVYRLIKRPG